MHTNSHLISEYIQCCVWNRAASDPSDDRHSSPSVWDSSNLLEQGYVYNMEALYTYTVGTLCSASSLQPSPTLFIHSVEATQRNLIHTQHVRRYVIVLLASRHSMCNSVFFLINFALLSFRTFANTQ